MFIWIWLSLSIILGLVILFIASPPTFVSDWFAEKLEMHPHLDEENVTVKIEEKNLKGEDKAWIVDCFNEALFIEKYGFIPERSGAQITIDTRKGKQDVRYCVYLYNDRVDVFKHYKRKMVAYRLIASDLMDYAASYYRTAHECDVQKTRDRIQASTEHFA